MADSSVHLVQALDRDQVRVRVQVLVLAPLVGCLESKKERWSGDAEFSRRKSGEKGL